MGIYMYTWSLGSCWKGGLLCLPLWFIPKSTGKRSFSQTSLYACWPEFIGWGDLHNHLQVSPASYPDAAGRKTIACTAWICITIWCIRINELLYPMACREDAHHTGRYGIICLWKYATDHSSILWKTVILSKNPLTEAGFFCKLSFQTPFSVNNWTKKNLCNLTLCHIYKIN